MVYDCFTFFNELDLLEIRLNILDEIVDKFVIVEATKTHRGIPKPLYLKDNIERFKKFKNKIIYIAVDDYPKADDHYINEKGDDWTLENWQRAAIERGLTDIKPDDVIILSDLDEIPKPKILRSVISRISTGIVGLKMDNLYFYLNYLSTEPLSNGPRICRYSTYETTLSKREISNGNLSGVIPQYRSISNFNKLRAVDPNITIKHGAWHFSYLGGEEAIVKKAAAIVEKSATHNAPTDIAALKKLIYNGQDIYGRGYVYRQITRKSFLPVYIADNINLYNRYLVSFSFSHRLLLDVQFLVFFFGMRAERALNKLGLSAAFIHKIKAVLYSPKT